MRFKKNSVEPFQRYTGKRQKSKFRIKSLLTGGKKTG